MQRHLNDSFVRCSKAEGYRARSAYKLLEIIDRLPQIKEAVVRPNSIFADLGAAPGSWCQVLANQSHSSSKILAIDRIKIDPLKKVTSVQEDFSLITDEIISKYLNPKAEISPAKFDLILSDICVEMSGNSITDNCRNADLWNIAFEFCKKYLKTNNHFIIKLFDSHEMENFRERASLLFSKVQVHKPRSSRSESSEKYLICLGKLQKIE